MADKQPEAKKRKRQKAVDPNHADVDCTNSKDKLWLVKVPKYLGQKWLESPSMEVGKLSIKRFDRSTEVSFKLNEMLANTSNARDQSKTPTDHKMILSAPSRSETLGVLSRCKDESDREVRKIEGSIVQNAVCQPSMMNSAYNDLKRREFKGYTQTKRAIVLDQKELPTTFKPRAVHEERREQLNSNKDGRKNRMEPDALKERLFQLFEKHQYYTLKDLGSLTNQPMQFLKETLREIAVYNTKASVKNKWELKEEYRYYQKK